MSESGFTGLEDFQDLLIEMIMELYGMDFDPRGRITYNFTQDLRAQVSLRPYKLMAVN